MTRKACLRCDWHDETEGSSCPKCGARPLYVVGAPPPAKARKPVREDPEEQVVPSQVDAVETSSRSSRSAGAFVVGALVLIVTVGTWLKAHEELPATGPRTDAAALDTAADDGSPTPVVSPSPSDAGVVPTYVPSIGRRALTLMGVPFSYLARAPGWERRGSISINKSARGPQGAEAIILWTTFPYSDFVDPCFHLLSPPVGPSISDLAVAVSRAPGTELVDGPSDVTVGGRAAKHVVLTVRGDVGCRPGFFFTWNAPHGGALWTRTGVGDTIRMWIVDVDGTRFVIEAETTEEAGPALEREIRQIVRSIRFGSQGTQAMVEIAERFMEARNAYDIETALSLLAEDGATVQLMNDNAMNADMDSVRLDRDELALALDAEHLYGVRFEPFRCRRASGSWRQGQIVCSYRLDNRLRRAQHMGPMRTSFRIGVRHGRIRILSFPWLNISWNPDGFLPAEYEPFVTWLEVNHPDAGGPMESGVIFRSEGQELIHILTRKSLDLLADYLDEFERSL